MVDTFELIVIDTGDTLEELQYMEIEYIKYYNSYYINDNGYNMTHGGEGTNGYVYTEEARQKLGERSKKQWENPEYRQKASETSKKQWENPEARQQMSDIKTQYYKDHPEAGKEHGERMTKHYEDNQEARQKASDIKTQYYKDHPEARKEHGERMTKHYEDNPEAEKEHSERMKKYFESNPEAGKEQGERIKKYYDDHPDARQKCSERIKKYYDDHPDARQKCSERMKKHYEDSEARQKILDTKGQNKPFDVSKVDGTFIKTFTYQFEAIKYLREELHIKSTIKISSVLSGNRKSSAGFVFKYK